MPPALTVALVLYAQAHAQDRPMQFEVASIKPVAVQPGPGSVRPTPGNERYVAVNCPLKLLIATAYQVKNDYVSGGPE